MGRLRVTWPAMVVAATIVVVLTGIAFVAWPRHEIAVSCDGTAFSRSAWSNGGDAQTDEGHRLVACGRLIGMTEPALTQLLGEPAERDAAGVAWEMGPDGMGIDSMFLAVTLERGRVVSASVGQG